MGVERFKKTKDDDFVKAINQKDFKDVLYSMYSRFGFECLDVLKNIKKDWNLIIKDDDLREFCIPSSFQNGILYVKILHSVAKNEFMNNLPLIKQNLKVLYPDVIIQDVRIAKK